MGKFEFRKNTVSLDVAGIKFEMGISGVSGKMKDFSKEAMRLAKSRMKEQQKKEAGIAMSQKAINSLLGSNAFEKIFATREPELSDVIDILDYITYEVNQHNAKYTKTKAPTL